MDERKLLYIGETDFTKTKSGSDVVNSRNLKLLDDIYKNNLYITNPKRYETESKYPIISKLFKLWNSVRFYLGQINNSDYEYIIKIISECNIDDIFCSNSLYGKFLDDLKKLYPKIRIISFFHNVEAHYYDEELKINGSFKKKVISLIIKRNELYTVRHSDVLITLNKRDANMLYKIYKKQATLQLPTTFEDKYDSSKATDYIPLLHNRIHLLFVGVNFFANTCGIKWFIENVLPEISKAHLTIVGKDMNKVFTNSSQVTVYGFVEDLSSFYYSADIVIMPIFYGAGMKTKTAEALMYGCPIIGTNEAFEGYEFNLELVGALANTKEEMISSILEISQNIDRLLQFRLNSRNIFMRLYNTELYTNVLRTALQK